MDIGTMLPTYSTDEHAIPSAAIRRFAKQAEALGLAGLWCIDHLVIPEYFQSSVLDPLVALSHAAAVTQNIDLGTSILILPTRQTAHVASQVASLGHLSDCQITLGLGAGYVPAEFDVAGIPMDDRGRRLNEGIEVLDRLFSGETSFDGDYHSFDDVRIDPVLNDPPTLLAGGGPKSSGDKVQVPEGVLQRIAMADGWIAPPLNPETAANILDDINAYLDSHRSDPVDIRTVMLNYMHLMPEGTSASTVRREQRHVFESVFGPARGFDAAGQYCLVGTIDDIVTRLSAYEEVGFDQVICGPISSNPDHFDQQLQIMESSILPSFG